MPIAKFANSKCTDLLGTIFEGLGLFKRTSLDFGRNAVDLKRLVGTTEADIAFDQNLNRIVGCTLRAIGISRAPYWSMVAELRSPANTIVISVSRIIQITVRC
jgi:hypothetical protein